MVWTDDWSINEVENNFKVLGVVDPEDIVQLIKDSKELLECKELLRKSKRYLGSNNSIGAMELNKKVVEYLASE